MYVVVGGDNKFYCKGVYVLGVVQGYLIDKKIVEQYYIIFIDQFKDLQIVKLFDINNDGKVDFIGCISGWGCEVVINYQIDVYGLSKIVIYNQGNYVVMMVDIIVWYKEGKLVFYYIWMLYWVSDVLKSGKDVVWLQVLFFFLLGEQKNIDIKLVNGVNYGFLVNIMYIVVNKVWVEKNLVVVILFSVMKLLIVDINVENVMMYEGYVFEVDINGYVDGWIKVYQLLFDSWVKIVFVVQQ